MKIFISIISLLLGIMIGAAITTFLVIKKNQTVKSYLCKDFEEIDEDKEKEDNLNLTDIIKSSLNNFSDDKIKAKEAIPDILNKIKDTPDITTSDVASTTPILSGPGECKTEDECLSYCSNLEHLKECLEFAKSYVKDSP